MRGGGPMFGEWGGLILQLTITVVVILGLIAVVYWLVRRYSGGGLGRLSRARVPRLAVIDAMAIDGRRRLVLVRRDNVEHLILLGGPSDVVVEQAIQRQRQRPAARPQAVGTAAEMSPPSAEPSVSLPENPPIPFPPPRAHQPNVQPPTSAPMAERTVGPARRAAQPQPTRSEAASAAAPAAPLFQPIAEPLPSAPEPARFETSVYEPRTIYAPNAATNGHQAHRDYGNGASQPAATSPFIMPSPADSETAAKVNDLEREMARLLGEITASRPS